MSFSSRLLPLLRCQACGGGFDFAASKPAGSARAEFGVVACRCSKYPVVDGIPIIQQSAVGLFEHTTGASQVESVTPPELVRLIEKGQGEAALSLCLMPDRPTRWPGWQGWRTRRNVAKLLARRDAIRARDVLPMYFGIGAARIRHRGLFRASFRGSRVSWWPWHWPRRWRRTRGRYSMWRADSDTWIIT